MKYKTNDANISHRPTLTLRSGTDTARTMRLRSSAELMRSRSETADATSSITSIAVRMAFLYS
mgnify:CR=1 FL=1